MESSVDGGCKRDREREGQREREMMNSGHRSTALEEKKHSFSLFFSQQQRPTPSVSFFPTPFLRKRTSADGACVDAGNVPLLSCNLDDTGEETTSARLCPHALQRVATRRRRRSQPSKRKETTSAHSFSSSSSLSHTRYNPTADTMAERFNILVSEKLVGPGECIRRATREGEIETLNETNARCQGRASILRLKCLPLVYRRTKRSVSRVLLSLSLFWTLQMLKECRDGPSGAERTPQFKASDRSPDQGLKFKKNSRRERREATRAAAVFFPQTFPRSHSRFPPFQTLFPSFQAWPSSRPLATSTSPSA